MRTHHHEAEDVTELVERDRSQAEDLVWVCLDCGEPHDETEGCPEACAHCGGLNFWASAHGAR